MHTSQYTSCAEWIHEKNYEIDWINMHIINIISKNTGFMHTRTSRTVAKYSASVDSRLSSFLCLLNKTHKFLFDWKYCKRLEFSFWTNSYSSYSRLNFSRKNVRVSSDVTGLFCVAWMICFLFLPATQSKSVFKTIFFMRTTILAESKTAECCLFMSLSQRPTNQWPSDS